MQTLKMDDQTARKVYPSAIPEFKTMLEESFPKGFFSQKITERVQTMEDIFSVGGKSLLEIISLSDTKDEAAYKVLKFGIKVLNEEWVADYSNSDQYKYEPRFYHKAGFGLSYDDFVIWYTRTAVGPRLCYRSYEIMMHGIKIMQKYYNDFFN